MNLIWSRTPTDYSGEIACGMCDSPYGPLFVAESSEGICALAFADGADEMRCRLRRRLPRATLVESSRSTRSTRSTLNTLRLAPAGTDFQLAVWRALTEVPAGTTATYAQIAAAIGRPTAHRAVGAAVGANPIAILVPCHRILPSDGTLGRYHWGVARKAALLSAEGLSRRL